ncbi:Sodium/hydrogen exchanger [Fasciola gigantica]|uniref:Sodium/hydrogen exchanger n=1 Tax=Fasciola gigantica TaxID=46835 RepID=A0A504Z489_FASGI|nr:Sodium/hydrogen exchanger [Fasciola gigantica]
MYYFFGKSKFPTLLFSFTRTLASETSTTSKGKDNPAAVIVQWHLEEYAVPLAVLTFILCVIALRIGYQRVPIVAAWVPESLVLLVAGILFGHLLSYTTPNYATANRGWNLTPRLFFNYLLPPIVLDSAYTMYNRTIVDYMIPILVFAVLGTIMNFVLISALMFTVYLVGWLGTTHLELDLKTFLLFSSLIVAVDPVAVLAIFQDIGVDLGLYYLVFGESLLNDAVTVVLYNVVSSFAGLLQISALRILYAFLALFTVSFGGILIGLIIGIVTCVATRPKSSLSAVIVLLCAYFSYILGDCLGWSGIMSLITCGLIQTAYAFHNLSCGSVVVVRKVTKVTAEISESVIFLFIGLEVLAPTLVWHTGFILWALFACLVARSVVVLLLTFVINRLPHTLVHISVTQQILLIYGGLRGAVCLCLAILVKPQYFRIDGGYKRELLITTALFIILFTIGLMGLTMKPLVKWLNIPMEKERQLSLFRQLNEHIMDECLCAMETISGEKGQNLVRDWFIHVDDQYIRKWLQRDPETHDQKILNLYKQISLKLHYAMVEPNLSRKYLQQLPESIKLLYSSMKTPGGSRLSLPQQSPQLNAGDDQDGASIMTVTETLLDGITSFSHLDAQQYKQQQLQPQQKTGRFVRFFDRLRCSRKSRPNVDNMTLDFPESGTITDSHFVTDMSVYFRSSRHASFFGPDRHPIEFANSFVHNLISKSVVARNYERFSHISQQDRTRESSIITLNQPMSEEEYPIQIGKLAIRTLGKHHPITSVSHRKRTKIPCDMAFYTASIGPGPLPPGHRVASWIRCRAAWGRNILQHQIAYIFGNVQHIKRTKRTTESMDVNSSSDLMT